MKPYAILLALLCAINTGSMAQNSGPDVRKYVGMVNNGNVDDVRRELPALLTKYPNHPGVMYLQGLVTREGSEAIRTYQSIVDNFPESEWADDALYRVYQFYYALGLYRTAEIKMKQLAERYPNSPFAKSGTGAQTAESVPAEEPVPAADSAAVAPTAHTSTEPASAQPDTALHARYVLQVGAFSVQSNAQTFKDRFEAAGYPVEMISKVKDARALFLVWVGNYAAYEEARTAGQDVKRKMGVDAIVISR